MKAVLIGVALAALVVLTEGARRAFGWSSSSTRRMIHAGVGLAATSFPYIFSFTGPVYLLAGTFVVLNSLGFLVGWPKAMHADGSDSWGTIVLPLAIIVALPLTWDLGRPWIFQSAFAVLGIADPLAAWIGSQSTIDLPGMKKTFYGTATFVGTTVIVTTIALWLWSPSTGPLPQPISIDGILLACTVAWAAGLAELLGEQGGDNLSIVLAVVATLSVASTTPGWTGVLLLALLTGTVVLVGARTANFLSFAGAVAGALFAATLLAAGGWPWLWPGIAFFLGSSIISKIERHGERFQIRKRRGQRTRRQVYANGGIAWSLGLVHLFYPHPALYAGFVGALAAASADTWNTEIGTMFGRQPRLLFSGKTVPPGTSGAVSVAGTLAGIVGAMIIWAVLWITPDFRYLQTPSPGMWLLILVVGGTVGATIDSVLGATVQKIEEGEGSSPVATTREQPKQSASGLAINNHHINWACTASGALITAILYSATM